MSENSPSRQGSHSQPERQHSDPSHQSPLRHHQRAISSNTPVKETRNAHSEYQSSEDDGASQLRINQYIIGQEIGRGSFGAVHLATDQYGKEYAVKEFSKTRLRRRVKSNMLRQARQQCHRRFDESLFNLAARPERMAYPQSPTEEEDNSFDLIKEEIAIMKKLNHGNLVSLIEVLDDPDGDSLYMVLEMCKKGVVMRIEVEETVDPYDEESCRCWFRDLILGIEYLHSQGVIHRDIKPDNCLLTEDDMLKIVDFGVSEMFEKQSEMRIAKSAGSPAFMAPELCIVKHGDVSGKSADIWSMGVTLYCLRFGRVPFRKSAVLELYESIVNDPLQLDPNCGAEFTDLMTRLLAKDPTRRITMEELREHPWVTKGGTDPLLPAEENCADLVMPPTEEEKNAAITGNMGRLVAVVKAVHRFKSLLERNHPDLVEGFLGHASRIVQPPLVLARANQDLDHQAPANETSNSICSPDASISGELGRLMEQFKSTVISSAHLGATSQGFGFRDSNTDPDTSPKDEGVGPGVDGQDESIAEERRDSGKGHAHDPLQDHLYLEIGPGPPPGDTPDQLAEFSVSESPPPAGYNVYERAYKEEVDRIKKDRGRHATIYLTRRVEERQALPEDKNDTSHELLSDQGASKPDRFADMVGKAVQSAGATYQSRINNR